MRFFSAKNFGDYRLLKFYFAEKQYQFRIKKIKGYEYIEGISYKELN